MNCLGADFGSTRQHDDDPDKELVRKRFWMGPVLVAQGVLDPQNYAADRLERYTRLRAGVTSCRLSL